MKSALKNFLKNRVPKSVIRALYPHTLRGMARRHGISLRIGPQSIDLDRGRDTLRLSKAHALHVGEAIATFDHFFSAVKAQDLGERRLVDFSAPRYHEVAGFDLFPVLFPSFPEPLAMTRHYMEFGALGPGMRVLDLGAYSGLTSILFSQAVGPAGLVVAVEADLANIQCIRANVTNFAKHCPNRIALLEGAVWEHNEGIDFSVEGNMGSSATAIVGGNRGSVSRVPSYTLSAIAEIFGLERVDFIKCDVEGAEAMVFKDRDFFRRFAPRIVIETHYIDGKSTEEACVRELEASGYSCEPLPQDDYPLPLLKCVPKRVSA
jgi:FkbM family methyltransferase